MRLDHLLSMEKRSEPEKATIYGGSLESSKFVVQFSEIKDLRKRDPLLQGGVAQLGEHLPCKQGVMGSIPIISTSR